MYPDFEAISQGAGVVAGFLGILLGGWVLSMGVGVVLYVLRALGLYTIAQRRELKHPWMAFLPLTDLWILGSISDQYQYVSQGLVRSRRKVLVGLGIAALVISLVCACGYVAGIVRLMMNLPQLEQMTQQQVTSGLLASLGGPLIAFGVMAVLALISTVLQYVCLYHLFASCRPGQKELFLVLSILIPVSVPILIFACRNQDRGMPPRRVRAAIE